MKLETMVVMIPMFFVFWVFEVVLGLFHFSKCCVLCCYMIEFVFYNKSCMVQLVCRMQVNLIDISWYLHHECFYYPNMCKCYHNLILKNLNLQ